MHNSFRSAICFVVNFYNICRFAWTLVKVLVSKVFCVKFDVCVDSYRGYYNLIHSLQMITPVILARFPWNLDKVIITKVTWSSLLSDEICAYKWGNFDLIGRWFSDNSGDIDQISMKLVKYIFNNYCSQVKSTTKSVLICDFLMTSSLSYHASWHVV